MVFNVVIYFYIKSSLYKEIDRSLLSSRKIVEENIQKNSQYIKSLDPRIISILRDDTGNILMDNHISMFYKNNEGNIKPTRVNELYDIKFKGFNFRTIAFSADYNNKTIMVQLLRNTNSEKEFLDRLLEIIAWAGIIIFFISIEVGEFLADRTMIPISKAWEKQRQFVEDASHELRTPLTVIQSQLELTLKKPEDKIIDRANYLAIALSETRRLSKLVSDLLILARSDSDVIEIEKKPVDICNLIKKVTDTYVEIADIDDKCISVKLEKNVIVYGDEQRIYQLMVILLDNALKYTNKGGNIEISATKKQNKCNIIVKDSGIGIKEEESKLIFERFYRGDKSRARETGGAGLGLSIAKWIVEKHNGNIKALSNSPVGTIIEVVLPVK
jgi:signal transduction histidine kinase